jgi:HAD superfamily hydrolase (TIGR01490 family)
VRLVLFDLDRTLIDVNSGALWIVAEWRAGRISWRQLAFASYWLGLYSLGREGGLEEAINAAVTALVGADEAELEARVRAWFERDIRHRTRPGAVEAIRRHREAGDTLVIATSGTTYAAEAAAEAWGLDAVVATRLEAVDGRLTGRIARSCVGASKATAVEEWVRGEGHDLASAVFYTDSATDLELMLRVAEPVAVHPDRVLRRIASQRGWPIERW